ncbi:MAG: tetratricopeptide repeat protein [Gammaproteobacteria bacterium]
MAHWRLDHTELALADLLRVIELEPKNFDAHVSADRILSRQRRWNELLVLWSTYSNAFRTMRTPGSNVAERTIRKEIFRPPLPMPPGLAIWASQKPAVG